MKDSRFTYDSNGKQVGLNWSALASTSERPSVRATLPPLSQKGRPVAAASLANLRPNASRKYDYEEIARLWSAGLSNKEIMAEVGCGQSTVLLALKTIQPEGYTGKSGPRPIEKCKRGHDMKVHGKVYNKSGTRTCTKCKSERDRAAYERAKARKAAQR